jgi:hypothetical protein
MTVDACLGTLKATPVRYEPSVHALVSKYMFKSFFPAFWQVSSSPVLQQIAQVPWESYPNDIPVVCC